MILTTTARALDARFIGKRVYVGTTPVVLSDVAQYINQTVIWASGWVLFLRVTDAIRYHAAVTP